MATRSQTPVLFTHLGLGREDPLESLRCFNSSRRELKSSVREPIVT